MRKVWIGILLLGMPAFGQLDSNTVTVTASRSITVQPDQVRLSVQVSSAADANLEDVLAGLPGITADNLTGVSISDRSLYWNFSLTVPLAGMTETIASLQAQKLNYFITGTSPSAAACSQTDLIADATAQARKIAAAAGIAVGRVLSVSDGGVRSGVAVATVAQRILIYDPITTVPYPGNIIPVGQILFFPPLSPSPTANCAIVVKFSLGR